MDGCTLTLSMEGGMGYNMVALAKGKDTEGENVSIIRTLGKIRESIPSKKTLQPIMPIIPPQSSNLCIAS